MCYAKPGPRCSAHALQKLHEVKVAKEQANPFDYNEFNELTDLVNKYQLEYDSTPQGQKDLQAEIDSNSFKYELELRLEAGKAMRETQMLAAKRAKETGIIPQDDIVYPRDRFNQTLSLLENKFPGVTNLIDITKMRNEEYMIERDKEIAIGKDLNGFSISHAKNYSEFIKENIGYFDITGAWGAPPIPEDWLDDIKTPEDIPIFTERVSSQIASYIHYEEGLYYMTQQAYNNENSF